jgi:hypothetical protein
MQRSGVAGLGCVPASHTRLASDDRRTEVIVTPFSNGPLRTAMQCEK